MSTDIIKNSYHAEYKIILIMVVMPFPQYKKFICLRACRAEKKLYDQAGCILILAEVRQPLGTFSSAIAIVYNGLYVNRYYQKQLTCRI